MSIAEPGVEQGVNHASKDASRPEDIAVRVQLPIILWALERQDRRQQSLCDSMAEALTRLKRVEEAMVHMDPASTAGQSEPARCRWNALKSSTPIDAARGDAGVRVEDPEEMLPASSGACGSSADTHGSSIRYAPNASQAQQTLGVMAGQSCESVDDDGQRPPPLAQCGKRGSLLSARLKAAAEAHKAHPNFHRVAGHAVAAEKSRLDDMFDSMLNQISDVETKVGSPKHPNLLTTAFPAHPSLLAHQNVLP